MFWHPASQNENPLGVLFGSALYGFSFPGARGPEVIALCSPDFPLASFASGTSGLASDCISNLILANFFPPPTFRRPSDVGPTRILCVWARTTTSLVNKYRLT